MAEGSYNQFCPVAMAAEVLCTRWTLILLRELAVGSTRFNELRRGLPRISPGLLSKRLKTLETAGIVSRSAVLGAPELYEYRLTAAGRDLRPIVEAIGVWGQQWIETEATLKNLDVNLLMWDIRRNIDLAPMPQRRSVIQIIFTDMNAARRNWWLLLEPGRDTDLCSVDPGFDADLYLATTLRALTEAWLGYAPIARLKEEARLVFTGPRPIETAFCAALKLSPFAKVAKLVA